MGTKYKPAGTDVLRELVAQGKSMVYLEKVIERMDSILREEPKITYAELVRNVQETDL